MKGNLPSENSVIIFWHGIMLPCWKIFSKFHPVAVVSSSKDGEKLVHILEKWNFDFIRGSSSKRGKEVLKEIISTLSNRIVLMTPDGPRGPEKKLKPGAIVAAQRAKVPLYYLKTKIQSKKVFLKSWDKFEFPLPFSRIDIEISSPNYISHELSREDIEVKISEIEGRML